MLTWVNTEVLNKLVIGISKSFLQIYRDLRIEAYIVQFQLLQWSTTEENNFHAILKSAWFAAFKVLLS